MGKLPNGLRAPIDPTKGMTLTVMSIGLATEAGGGFQHVDNLWKRSLSVLT
jgi:hypothetical protein